MSRRVPARTGPPIHAGQHHEGGRGRALQNKVGRVDCHLKCHPNPGIRRRELAGDWREHTPLHEGSAMYLDPTRVVASVSVPPRNFGTLASTPLVARRPLPASPLADDQQQTREHDE